MPEETDLFFCRHLKEGALYAGHFTSVISMIACALAFSVFFRESAPDDGDSKLLSFTVACYTIFYIFMSRHLIHGIKEEQREKFICWVIMSILTVIFFLSGIIFVIILLFSGKFQENTMITITVLGTIILCLFLTGVLVYCIWGVVTLWRFYGGGSGEGVVI